MGYELHNREIVVQFPAETTDFFSAPVRMDKISIWGLTALPFNA